MRRTEPSRPVQGGCEGRRQLPGAGDVYRLREGGRRDPPVPGQTASCLEGQAARRSAPERGSPGKRQRHRAPGKNGSVSGYHGGRSSCGPGRGSDGAFDRAGHVSHAVYRRGFHGYGSERRLSLRAGRKLQRLGTDALRVPEGRDRRFQSCPLRADHGKLPGGRPLRHPVRQTEGGRLCAPAVRT